MTNMNTAADVDNNDLDLAELEAALEAEFGDEIEIEEDAAQAEIEAEFADAEADEEHYDAVAGELELEEAKAEAYAEQESEADMNTEIEDKPKKAKRKAAGEPKAKREPRKTLAGYKRSEVILDRLGEKAGDYMVLEVADAEKSADELAAQQQELLSIIDQKMSKKIAEKAVNVMSWVAGKSKLRTDVAISLGFLVKQGSITKNELINHIATGTDKPRGMSTAKAQGGNVWNLMIDLKMGRLDGKVMTVNEESLIVENFKAQQAA